VSKWNGDIKWLTKALIFLFVIAIVFGFYLHNRDRAEAIEYNKEIIKVE